MTAKATCIQAKQRQKKKRFKTKLHRTQCGYGVERSQIAIHCFNNPSMFLVLRCDLVFDLTSLELSGQSEAD